MNVEIGKDENDKVCLYNLPNRSGEYQAECSLKNSLPCLNTKFQQKMGPTTDLQQPDNTKAQLNF